MSIPEKLDNAKVRGKSILAFPALPSLENTQLLSINQQIRELAPHGNIFRTFARAVCLAAEAIDLAEAAQQKEPARFRAELEFWQSFRDYAMVALTNSLGNNQSLAEAQISLQLLEKAGGQ